MATIKSENWDGVTAPALPSGWTVDSALVTATTNSPTSAPNSLIHPAASANASNIPHATWATQDTNSGNVQVSATVRYANSGAGAAQQEVWVFARASVVAANATWSSVSYYYAGIVRNDPSAGFFLHKRVSGTDTALGLVGATAFADATNYRIFLSCAGTAIQARCQRLSDSFWLNSSGVFVSDPTDQTVAIAVTDTGLAAAAGYSGVAFYLDNTSGGDLGVDDWLLETQTAGRAPASFYVAPSGSDANNGTSTATPWQTLGKVTSTSAAGGFVAGDRILLQGGQTHSGNLVLTSSGTAAAPIVLSSYGGGLATINPGTGTGIQVQDADWVWLCNLLVSGPGVTLVSNTISTTSTGAGVEVISTQTQSGSVATWRRGVYLDNLQISGTYWGINYHSYGGSAAGPFPVGYDDVRITNCTVSQCSGLSGITVWSNNATTGNYVGLQAGQQLYHKNVAITDCVVHDIYGDHTVTVSWTGSGIVVSNTQTGVTERCLVYNCGAASGSVSSGGPVANWVYASDHYVIASCEAHHQHDPRSNDGGGFDIDGGCTNCIIAYCYSHDNDGPGYEWGTYTGSGPTSGNILRYNVSQNDGRVRRAAAAASFGSPSSTLVHNNTFYCSSAGPGGMLLGSLSGTGDAFYNNIFWCGSGVAVFSGVSAGVFAGNLYWFGGGAFSVTYNGVTYSSLGAFQSVQESARGAATGVFADPLLVAPGSGGTLLPQRPVAALGAYGLAGSSPAVDAGLDLRTVCGVDPGPIDLRGARNRAGVTYDIGACEYGAPALLGPSGGLARVSLSGGVGG